jgi:ferrous iron transport protein B
MAISIILWILASYGVGDQFNEAQSIVTEKYASQNLTQEELD